jgi:HEPN domain-containing protein
MPKKNILFNGTLVGSYEATDDEERDAAFVHDFLVDKGFIKEIQRHAQIHGQANAFAEVANEIYARDLSASPYKGTSAPPFVVNATFSIELYLKAVLDFYGQKSWGHDLGVLFATLSPESKAIFEQAASDVRHLYKLEPEATYAIILQALGKAFEHWRYIFEKEAARVDIQAIRYAMHVSHEACCRIRGVAGKT